MLLRILWGKYGKVIQSDKNDMTRIKSCGKTGSPNDSQCYYFSLEPTSNADSEKNYKARLELNIPLSPPGQLRASQQGNTYKTQWYFYVDPKNVVTNGFFNIHQVFGEGFGPFICHSLIDGKFSVNYSFNLAKPTDLGTTNAKDLMGKWVLVNEIAHFDNNGWYEVSFTDAATGKAIFSVPRKPLNLWGKSKSIHAKFGIYRRKGDKNHGSWPTSHVAFSDFKFTKI